MPKLIRNSSSTLAMSAAVLLTFGAAQSAHAFLVFDALVDLSGTGLGAVNTITTAHDPGGGNAAFQDGIESGCVGRSGGADLVGDTACRGGLPGGDEIAINQTVPLSAITGLVSLSDLAAVFNVAETGQDLGVNLDNIYLTVFDEVTDAIIFEAFLAAANVGMEFVDGAGSGTGNSAFAFVLDATQQAAAAAAGFDPNWRVGGGFETVEGTTNDGNETMFVIAVVDGQPVPEPTTLLLLGLGLAGLGFARKRPH